MDLHFGNGTFNFSCSSCFLFLLRVDSRSLYLLVVPNVKVHDKCLTRAVNSEDKYFILLTSPEWMSLAPHPALI